MYEHLTETCISSESKFEGKVLHVFLDQIRLPNGGTGFREYIKHKGAVAVLPLTDAGEVICVRQYRYAVGSMMLEIPAGKLDYVGEVHREAALRELREETGATPAHLTHLGTYIGSPAILSERIELFLAEGLSFGETDFDEDEFIVTERIPLSRLVDDVLAGKISDGKTQVAVLWANELLRRRGEEKHDQA